jgi:hypothetical protein
VRCRVLGSDGHVVRCPTPGVSSVLSVHLRSTRSQLLAHVAPPVSSKALHGITHVGFNSVDLRPFDPAHQPTLPYTRQGYRTVPFLRRSSKPRLSINPPPLHIFYLHIVQQPLTRVTTTTTPTSSILRNLPSFGIFNPSGSSILRDRQSFGIGSFFPAKSLLSDWVGFFLPPIYLVHLYIQMDGIETNLGILAESEDPRFDHL